MDVRELLFKGLSIGCSNHGCIITGPKTGMGTNGQCHCLKEFNRTQLCILQSRLSVLLSGDKYAIVPVEPTVNMIEASLNENDDPDNYWGSAEALNARIYKAMIAAAQDENK